MNQNIWLNSTFLKFCLKLFKFLLFFDFTEILIYTQDSPNDKAFMRLFSLVESMF